MIGSFSLHQIAEQLDARIVGPDAAFNSVSIDTRTLQSGDLFVALKGPAFNGHAFTDSARDKGASGLVVSEQVSTQLPALIVSDTREALGRIARLNRDQFKGKVLAITGSAGKTTVKEMAASILSQKGNVLATRGNFNNEIGVPLTLLRITADNDYAVLELGASSIGEIAYTAALVEPDVAIITNAAEAHIEGFGSLNNVVQAKGEIIDGLPEQGVAVINVDDLNAYKWLQRAGTRPVTTFSLSNKPEADFGADKIVINRSGACQFTLVTPQGEIDIVLQHLGKHNIANALAAAAGAMVLGASLMDIRAGLEQVQPVKGRMISQQGINGARVIDDTYNANPESLRAAVDVLALSQGYKILVLGDMAELGEEALRNHADSARYALDQGVNELYSVGILSANAARVFGDNGHAFSDKKTLIDALSSRLDQDATVLVKGSRSAQMEQVVEAITGGKSNAL